jgi:hypothetical protein
MTCGLQEQSSPLHCHRGGVRNGSIYHIRQMTLLTRNHESFHGCSSGGQQHESPTNYGLYFLERSDKLVQAHRSSKISFHRVMCCVSFYLLVTLVLMSRHGITQKHRDRANSEVWSTGCMKDIYVVILSVRKNIFRSSGKQRQCRTRKIIA